MVLSLGKKAGVRVSHAEGTDRAQDLGWNVPVELLAENEEAGVAASEGAREGPW